MAKEFKHQGTVGGAASVMMIRESDGFFFDVFADDYVLTPLVANACFNLTEVGSTGLFVGDAPFNALNGAPLQQVSLRYYNQAAASFTYGDLPVGLGGLLVDDNDSVVSLASIADILLDTAYMQPKIPSDNAAQIALIAAMRGTDGANTTTPPNTAAINTAVEGGQVGIDAAAAATDVYAADFVVSYSGDDATFRIVLTKNGVILAGTDLGSDVQFFGSTLTKAWAVNPMTISGNALTATAANATADVLASEWIEWSITGTIDGATRTIHRLYEVGSGATLPVSQVHVDAVRTAVLKKTSDGLAGAVPEVMHIGDVHILAADFSHAMVVNGRFEELLEVSLHSGAAGGIVFDAAQQGVDEQQVKFHITAVTPGTYVVRVKVALKPNGEISSGYVTITVAL